MSAGALPPEVVFHILSFLASLGPLAPYSSVCRQWQEIIEKWTFCSIRLTSDQFAEFRRSLSPSKRRSYVRHLKLVALLPGYDKAARAQIENVEDRDQNNQAFTHAVYTCWEILSSWSQNHGNFLSLDLSAISPSDWRADPNGMRRRRWACHFPDQDYLGWRYEQSYLQLTGNTLPPVHIVGHLFVDGGNTYRKIAPSTVSKMVNALPQLQKIRALLYDNERKDQALRDSLRNVFALTFAQWPRSLKHLDLQYYGTPPNDGNFPPFFRSDPGKDALSLALHYLTQQLETVKICDIIIGPELFWPDQPDRLPHWPNLTSFTLSYAAATPSGQWLFERDPRCAAEYTIDQRDPAEVWPSPMIPPPQDYYPDQFRTKPRDFLNQLYYAAGRAAQQMPLLESMVLEATPQSGLPGMRDVLRSAAHWFRYRRARQSALWAGSGEFRIDQEALDAWQATARSHGYEALKIENVGFTHCPDPMMYDWAVSKDQLKKERGFRPWHA